MSNRRVFAVQKADDDRVYLYGVGNYIGDELPHRGMLAGMGITNPKIELDDGGVVYGCECWWKDESELESFMAGREMIKVSTWDLEDEDD